MQKLYQNEPKFNGVFSRNSLPKIKDGTYVINLDEYKSFETHWIALYVNDDNGTASYNATYFDSFGVKHNPKEIKKFIGSKNIATNMFRIQAYYTVMCGCVLVLLVAFDFILRAKVVRLYQFIFF